MLSRLAVTSRAAAAAARPLRASIHIQSARAAARPRAVAAPRKTNRRLATDEKPPQKKKSAVERATEDDIDDLVPLTPAQKVGVGLNLSAWAAGLGLASVCGYYIFRELMPTKLSPNSVFDKAFEVIRSNSTIERVYGTPLKGYGRDHGGHREGRRNFIENTPYVDEKDGSNRMRVRFNIKGPYGEGFAFAEVSDSYDGFVYLMVQNRRTAVVHTLVDNRMMLAAQAPRNEKERSALAGLLGTEPSSTGEKTDKW
jgi:import inner membrane translocase subunit TIM21